MAASPLEIVRETTRLERAESARAQIARLKSELDREQRILDGIERGCEHAWTDPKEDRESYQQVVLGPPVAHGSDLWHEPRFVADTRPVWTRTCMRCGRTEQTRVTRPVAQHVPDFR